MNDDRDQFLQRISTCLGRQSIPAGPAPFTPPHAVQEKYLSEASPEKIAEIFAAAARAAGTAVYECALNRLNETILTAIPQLAAGPILLSDDPLWQRQGTLPALESIEKDVRIWDQSLSREENIAIAEKAAVGMAVAELALAETGTVMMYSHKGCGRSVTLLPTTTLFIVPRSVIRPRLTQAMAEIQKQLGAGLPSAIHFVSGASSTSDIELVRVQGVHGPIKIAYIIVD